MIKITLPSFEKEFLYEELSEYRDDFSLYPGGIYFLYNEDGECTYIGKSKHLLKRLHSHAYSPFSDEVYSVKVIFEDNPSHRDIFETYAIMEFSPHYNKEKVYKNNGGDYVREEISDLQLERDELRTILSDLEAERDELIIKMTPPGRRRYNNNFDPTDNELTDAFYEYLDDLNEFNQKRSAEDFYDLQDVERRMQDVSEEIAEISDKIKTLLHSLRV